MHMIACGAWSHVISLPLSADISEYKSALVPLRFSQHIVSSTISTWKRYVRKLMVFLPHPYGYTVQHAKLRSQTCFNYIGAHIYLWWKLTPKITVPQTKSQTTTIYHYNLETQKKSDWVLENFLWFQFAVTCEIVHHATLYQKLF